MRRAGAIRARRPRSIKLLVIGAIAALIARPTTDVWPARKGNSERAQVAASTNYHVGEAAAVLAVAVQAPLFGDEEASDSADINAALDEPSGLDNLMSAISRTHDAPFTTAEMASLAKFMRGDAPKVADGGLPFSSAGGNTLASVGGRGRSALTRGRSGGSGGSPPAGGGGGAPQRLPNSVPQQVVPNPDILGVTQPTPVVGEVSNPIPPNDLADDNPPAQTPDNDGDEPSWTPPAEQPYFPPVAIAPPIEPDLSPGLGSGSNGGTPHSPSNFPNAPADENVGPHYLPMGVSVPPVGVEVEAVPEPATFAVWAGLSLAAGCFAWRKCHR